MIARSPWLAAKALAPLVSLVLLVAVASSAGGCQESISQSPCKDVPAGGCPLAHGLSCEDPTCAAAYACNPDGTWTFDHACAGYDASAPDASAADSSDGGAPPTFDAAGIDAAGANGGPGCTPLEAPACALGFALACPSGCCDCEELFVCANGGWEPWGYCDEDGGGIKPSN